MSALPEVPKPSRRSRGRNRMGRAHCPGLNPGPVFWLWTVFCDSPSRQIQAASGSIATKHVHHSGASAAEFHRLPDAPRVASNIPPLFLNASFIGFVAAAEAEAAPHRRLLQPDSQVSRP